MRWLTFVLFHFFSLRMSIEFALPDTSLRLYVSASVFVSESLSLTHALSLSRTHINTHTHAHARNTYTFIIHGKLSR